MMLINKKILVPNKIVEDGENIMSEGKMFSTENENEEMGEGIEGTAEAIEEPQKKKRKMAIIIVTIVAVLVVGSVFGYLYFNSPSREFCSLMEKGDYAAAEQLVSGGAIELTEDMAAAFLDAIVQYEPITLEGFMTLKEAQWNDISTLYGISKKLEIGGDMAEYITRLNVIKGNYREDLSFYQVLDDNRNFFENRYNTSLESGDIQSLRKVVNCVEEAVLLLSDSKGPLADKYNNAANDLIESGNYFIYLHEHGSYFEIQLYGVTARADFLLAYIDMLIVDEYIDISKADHLLTEIESLGELRGILAKQ